ncbi:AAA family ATPase [Candidatus Falkowbacteria bacterium]|jgi:chromosome segregation protein|nr:AAA family ATPase [Candidatus Falkowbacteria bacterium]MBT5503431.1 AAA family ATPase [Candidatus Falkowbacteria bacterium]MBT6574006.1 AAA family ATPase [Candidatus Falkowbacteria bacterium]MBT7348576.1 AAA family ATPase [Candidatus Falkowbacteria bacterium]MBT7500366.1 AAA family ATPase [Candidatus Falkowbacteria bacterium]
MYLQRLEIQGFKSFAKKTTFEFSAKSNHDSAAKSIVAIVGPNGSGKSNVADAIRWVLGEQSLKLIRCKKSDDVIFGGSETRARQGFAEASLIMNNEDNELPIDYTEVVLTRRVYRNGETEYLLNKSKVRLYDILILLAKANFGQRSYSIIGQGMVDHIINVSAFERKDFFDEATGVKQYQIKRDQSVNRLRRSRTNLDQTNKILAELEPRLRLLTRQIKKLEKRKEVETLLRQQQKKYYGYIWKNMQRDRQQFEEKFSIKDALKQDLEQRLEQVQANLAKLAKAESRKDIFNNLQKDYNRLQADKNEIQKDLSTIKGKMSLEYVKVGKQNLSWLENKKEEIGKRVNEIKESLNNLETKLEHKKQELEKSEVKIHELSGQLTVLNNNLRAAENDLSKIRSGGRYSVGMEAVKAVMRQKDSIKGIYGTISDLANVDKAYETALAVAAGNRLSAVVVQSDEVAVKCINYLRENRLGTVTFLPLNKLQVYSPNTEAKRVLEETGAIGFAVDLIGFDPKYKKAFQFVFGTTVVVDNVEHAKQIGVGRARMVTQDGDILEKSGAMRGGYNKGSAITWQIASQEQRLVSQEGKLKEIALLKQKIEDFVKQKQSLLLQVNDLRVEVEVGSTKKKGLDHDFADLTKEKEKISDEISENQVAPKDQAVLLKNLTSKKQELERQLEKIEEKVAEVRKKLDQFNLDEEKKKNEVFELQGQMQKYQMKLNDVNREVNDVNISLAKLETKKEELDKEIVQELGPDFKLETLKADEQILNLDQLWFEISKLKHNLEQIGGIDPEIIAEHKEVAERYEFLSVQAQDLEKAINDLEKIVKELDVIINKQFNASFKKINKAFEKYFTKIFDGGKAKLELIQKERKEKNEVGENLTLNLHDSSDDTDAEVEELLPEEQSKLLNTGIEIMVAPPNKKISNIAVLSGGERTMTSLALICAIIDSNPSPFIVMDEVEAALDESNSHKFSAILQELSYKAQFIIITHNRVTMHVADALYGVAMGDDGVSKTLSLDLQAAEKTVK